MLPLEPYDRNGLAGGPTQNNHFQTEQTNQIKKQNQQGEKTTNTKRSLTNIQNNE